MIVGTAIGTALIVFPLGVWIGYVWRDRLSRLRRTQYWVERWEREKWVAREREEAAVAAALVPKDDPL